VIRRYLWLAFAVILPACSSPRERLYVLDATAASGTPMPHRETVVLGPVSIPPELDRPQVMVLESGRLVMSEQDRWAVPLKQAIPRALAAELGERTAYRVVAAGSAAIEAPAARLTVDVSRFEASRTGGAVVAAHWLWRPTGNDAPVIEGDAIAHAGLHGAGYAALVDSLRQATAELAARIAEQLPPLRYPEK
jgi:uncharacterized protein